MSAAIHFSFSSPIKLAFMKMRILKIALLGLISTNLIISAVAQPLVEKLSQLPDYQFFAPTETGLAQSSTVFFKGFW
ncbi:MAG: hypothetical protein HY842_09910 [Bacteroidetes bacterium]|nr:hypothetical protein [Bacteroidota bacterium]